jgi:hypothetical protein
MRWRNQLLVLCAAAAVSVGVWWYAADPGTHEIDDELLVDADGQPLDEREAAARERREMQARARNMPTRESELVDARDAKYGTGAISRTEAEAGSEDAMTEVETFAKSKERIHREEWDTLYRSANDAFAVLSMHLDANEPGDRETLETAHRRLQEGLRRVRVRGKKFSDI